MRKIGIALSVCVAVAAMTVRGMADVRSLPIPDGESWWGIGGGWGRDMPFGAKSSFAADLRTSNAGHPVASLLVSDRGRYVWCDDPVGLKITNGTMRIESDRGKISL